MKKYRLAILLAFFLASPTKAESLDWIRDYTSASSGWKTILGVWPSYFGEVGLKYGSVNARLTGAASIMMGSIGVELLYLDFLGTDINIAISHNALGGAGDYRYEFSNAGLEWVFNEKKNRYFKFDLGIYKRIPQYNSSGLREKYIEFPVPSIGIGTRFN